ncbi:serine/threonine-protein phosphatase [Aliikangiella marina]|uniref:Serine/threonine-protein phosphatase n=1 Tax=Aliikangiella marina TaxID=1712262 RepID=A0A545TH09_9GAMM|nr:protein phosphatase 2C domain-containing protein [Aliikangiella marina]TQV76421.1 serine/threonine-protein phosphatase [Aliikangiella marina]
MSDSTIRRKVKWESAADTNVGMVRQANEDSILSRPEVNLWAVADGMGGHAVGDVASRMIKEVLERVSCEGALDKVVDEIEDALLTVNQQILQYSQTVLDNKVIGSTVVAMIIVGKVGICFWVGDSRLYRYRKGVLEQLTRDHSRVEELVQQGVLKPEEAQNHAESNVITRAVGVDDDFVVDVQAFDVQVKDTFLLCSDGLYNMLTNEEIALHLTEPFLEDRVRHLIENALDNGAPDNVSAIVIKGGFEKSVTREFVFDSSQLF